MRLTYAVLIATSTAAALVDGHFIILRTQRNTFRMKS